MSWDWWRAYVVLLDDAAKHEAKVRADNPNGMDEMPAVYVGVTKRPREARYETLKGSGRTSNKYVRLFGRGLAPQYYAGYKAVREKDAARLERQVASDLRERGLWVVCGEGFFWDRYKDADD
jgi:hypothetical protein